jgi:hypothetical protein
MMRITKRGYEEGGWIKKGSGSCPTTSSYMNSVESLGSAARRLINFIREVRQCKYHLL